MAQASFKNRITAPLGVADKAWFYRLWEIIPGLLSWVVLISPIVLSLVWPIAVAYFIIAFDLLWLLKSMRMSLGLVQAYRILKRAEKVDWVERMNELSKVDKVLLERQVELEKISRPGLFGLVRVGKNKQKYDELKREVARLQEIADHQNTLIQPKDIYHVIITAVYNESLEVLRPSLDAILASKFDSKRIIFVLAYEERGGKQTAENAKILEKEYASKFGGYMSICHPDGMKGEMKGKGANITFAGRIVKEYLKERSIVPKTLWSQH